MFADRGPWACDEAGCPATTVTCSMLSRVCHAGFSSLWKTLPSGIHRAAQIWQYCPVTCNRCADGHDATAAAGRRCPLFEGSSREDEARRKMIEQSIWAHQGWAHRTRSRLQGKKRVKPPRVDAHLVRWPAALSECGIILVSTTATMVPIQLHAAAHLRHVLKARGNSGPPCASGVMIGAFAPGIDGLLDAVTSSAAFDVVGGLALRRHAWAMRAAAWYVLSSTGLEPIG